MKFTNFKIILMAFAFLFACFSNLGFAGDCGNDDDSMQMLSDCYGNCCPMAWVFDDICDNGVRDWPVDSGIYIYLDCQEFYCDLYQCEGCTLECPEGQAPDCNGNCAPVEWITDDICDVGQRTFNGNAIVLACQEFAYWSRLAWRPAWLAAGGARAERGSSAPADAAPPCGHF